MINPLKDKVNPLSSKEEVYLALSSLIQEQIDLSVRKTQDENSFTIPSWSEYQAFQLGMQKAFQKVLQLLPDPVTGN